MDSSQRKASKRRKLSLTKSKINAEESAQNLGEKNDVDLQKSSSNSNADKKIIAQNKTCTESKEMSPTKNQPNNSPKSATKKVWGAKHREKSNKGSAKNRNSTENSSETKPNRTIADCFKNSGRERTVRCPICSIKVLHSSINDHLDTCVENEGSNVMENISEPEFKKSEKNQSIESNVGIGISQKKNGEIEKSDRKTSKRRKTSDKSFDIPNDSNAKSINTSFIKLKKISHASSHSEIINIDVDIEPQKLDIFNKQSNVIQSQSLKDNVISLDEEGMSNYDKTEFKEHRSVPKRPLSQSKTELTKLAKQSTKHGGVISESNNDSKVGLHTRQSNKHNRLSKGNLPRFASEQSKSIDDSHKVSFDSRQSECSSSSKQPLTKGASIVSESVEDASFASRKSDEYNFLSKKSLSRANSELSESVDDTSEASFASRKSEEYNFLSKKPLSRGNSELSASADDVSEMSFDDTEDNKPDPYYLANFKLVLDTVLSNEEDRSLFNQEDMEVIEKFQAFPLECQKLYIRLFQRKPGWFRCSKIEYPKIAKDLKPVLAELIKAGFFESESCLTDLQETLHLLSAGDLKDLAKHLHIIQSKTTQQKGQTKTEIIEAVIKHGKTQRTLFGNASLVVLKRAKSVLGTCVRVASEPKFVFMRVLLLFTMNILPEDDENKYNGQTQQLSTIFLANIGKLLYPTYTILREVRIFCNRDAMVTFAKAYQEKHDMSIALEVTGNLELAYSYYPKTKECYGKVLDGLQATEKPFSARLPIHLRCFSAEWVYTKMCYLGVEVLQKMKRYAEAVEQLECLLRQDVYCADCRGKWWDRLALNVHQHLKQPFKALEISKQGLEDPHVRFGRRLALVQRVRKIVSSGAFKKKKKDAENECKIDEDLLKEPVPVETVTIQGKRSEQLAVFISHEVTKTGEVKEDTMTFLSVEEYALSHYRQQGYNEGIHGETSTFTTLYGLFFWDIVFSDDIPDVFRAPYQSAPLDINYDTFYLKRKTLIDQRLDKVRHSSTEVLLEMVESSWNENFSRICSGLSWERFDSLDQAKQFVSCVGGKVLAGIFKHFAEDIRHWHSGMPDLVVWNSTTLQYRIVEVKGPGDRLSTKQQIWLAELAELGATVEVCYVTAVGGKKFRAPDT